MVETISTRDPMEEDLVPTFSADCLERFARMLFEARRVPAEEAAVVAHSLVDANLCGHDSHGVLRTVQYVKALDDRALQAGVELTLLHETPAVLAGDGNWGLGQVQAHRLLRRLVPKARSIGLAAGTLKQCGHVGRLGEYAEAAAALGLAFMASVNNHGFGRTVAPPGGKVGLIGTNPLCLAVPHSPDPIVLDIGTSVCAEGKVRVAFNKGEQLPEGWLLDPEGLPTTDPGVLYRKPRGSILPLGGAQAYKGFGLGLLLDLLVGGLSGGPCSNPEIEPRSANAVFFVLLDSTQFAGMDHFRHEIFTLAANVRACPALPGAAIMLPGDPERASRRRRAAEGIPLDEGSWEQLTELARRLGVEVPG
jgi:uncharacterized oxidoreductase